MSDCCSDLSLGDVGVPIDVDITGCKGPLGSTITSATLTFTGPDGTTFERSATPVTATRVRYVTVEADYDDPGFTEPGTWKVRAWIETADGRELRSLGQGAFTIGA